METCELISLDDLKIGDVKNLNIFMLLTEYLNLEDTQLNSQHIRLYTCDTLDDNTIFILTMGN
jgi:hypothetical protein